MATVILIVFLAVVAILGGWWLKRERINQKKDLVNKGKLAAGKFDEVVLPKKKPVKRKRKKREGNFWDPKYVPPEIPRKTQLEAWLSRAATVVDQLMPAVNAYRAGKAEDEPAQLALRNAESQLVKYYKADSTTELEAREWFETLEAKLRAYYDVRASAEASARTLRRLFNPAKDLAFDLRSLVLQARAWELYKAPEPFHEQFELVTLLMEALWTELDLANEQPGVSRDNFSRRESGDSLSWQKGSSRRRNSWNNWSDEPEPEPVQDVQIVSRARQTLLDCLPQVAALAAASHAAQGSQKKYSEAGKQISLTRPAKPTDAEVDALLTAALTWAQAYQAAKVQVYRDGVKVKQCQEGLKSPLAAVGKAVSDLKDADIPEQDLVVRDAIGRAYEQLVAFAKSAAELSSTAINISAPYALDKPETQTDRDAAASLRNLVRKAAYALAQSEAAKANHEAAKNEHVQQAEAVPPVLTQSSASAFVNAFSRMTDINTRNSEKVQAHRAKVKQLAEQHSERETQAMQAVQAVSTAYHDVGRRKHEWSATLEQMHSMATLFCAAFKK